MSTQSFVVSKYLTHNDLRAYARAVATFGENMKRLRTAKGLTQKDLAKKMKLASNTPISLWERTLGIPRADTVKRIADGIGCSTADLLAGVETAYDALRTARGDPPLEQRPAKRKRTG